MRWRSKNGCRPTVVRTLGHLTPTFGHALGHCGLGIAQDLDANGVVQRLQAILHMAQQSGIPLEVEATDILNDHHPGNLFHNILQTKL